MEQHIRIYTGEKIDVTYDAGRCIHAEECITRLSTVFDKSRRPWVQPDAGSADSIAATINHCPSGSLHYERKDDGAVEPIPIHNTIHLSMNGPLYLRGDFTIVNGVGECVVNDTRAALCRCGGSANKPFCDNTHRKNGFIAPDTVADPQPITETSDDSKLHIEATTNGPLRITGHFTVLNSKGEPVYQGANEEFCRCGGSSHKPFCDGTHEKNGFTAE